jgi:hypothetical protein
MKLISALFLLCSVLGQTACASARTAVAPITDSFPTAPDFVGHVVSARRESGSGPGRGPFSQLDLVVAIAPATVGNAGLVVSARSRVYLRHGTQSLIVAAADSIAPGDELEVWRLGGAALGTVQSPPDTPAYVASRIIIRR